MYIFKKCMGNNFNKIKLLAVVYDIIGTQLYFKILKNNVL